MLVHDRNLGQQIDFNSQVEAKVVSMGSKARLEVDGTPNYDLLRDAFTAHRKQSQLLSGLDVEDDELLDDWYCSDEFAQLLIHHFHQATKAAIQDVRANRIKQLDPCMKLLEFKTVIIRKGNMTKADARIQSRHCVLPMVLERS